MNYLGCDVQQGTTRWNLEPKFFAIALHEVRMSKFEVWPKVLCSSGPSRFGTGNQNL
jgi:hypothetical protein